MNHMVSFLLFSVLVFQEPTLTEVLRVGEIDGEDAFVFGRVLDVELDDNGTLFVLDTHGSEVRMFDLEGHHLGSFGRSGEGPGEFLRLRSMDWQDGQLTVTQGGRLSIFSEGGEFLDSHRISVSLANVALPLEGGGLVVLSSGYASSREVKRDRVLSVRRGEEWVDVQSGSETGMFYQLPRSAGWQRSSICAGLHIAPKVDGGFVAANGGDGRVTVYSLLGMPERSGRVAEEGLPLSRAQEAELLKQIQKYSPDARRSQVTMPAYESTICGIEVETKDRAWVHLAPKGEETAEVWQALDLETFELGRKITLPEGMKGMAFRNGIVAVISTSEFGVHTVVLYSIPGG